MQSPAWLESNSSSEVLRAARTLLESEITFIPSATGVAQEGQRLGRPSILTAHRKQEAEGSKPSTWQRVGMARPSARAALRIVVPGATETERPSIVMVTVGVIAARNPRSEYRDLKEGRNPKAEEDRAQWGARRASSEPCKSGNKCAWTTFARWHQR